MAIRILKLNSKHGIIIPPFCAYVTYAPSKLDDIWVNARRKFWITQLIGSKDVRYDMKFVI